MHQCSGTRIWLRCETQKLIPHRTGQLHRISPLAVVCGHHNVAVGLGDQPFISPEAWQAVAQTEGDIVVATYDGVRGNPVKLRKTVWDEFFSLTTEPDAGARTLMHLHPELVREVACKGVSADIDTTEDLSQWT